LLLPLCFRPGKAHWASLS